MSIFKEYRHGSMSEAEFRSAVNYEFRGDNDCGGTDNEDDFPCENCKYYWLKKVTENGKTRTIWHCTLNECAYKDDEE